MRAAVAMLTLRPRWKASQALVKFIDTRLRPSGYRLAGVFEWFKRPHSHRRLGLAFAAVAHCEPANQHYGRRREHGDRHAAATRQPSPRHPLTRQTCEDSGYLIDISRTVVSSDEQGRPCPASSSMGEACR